MGLYLAFFRYFKVKKHISETPLSKLNLWTLKLTILVVEIGVNINFLSLTPELNDLSLSSLKSKTKRIIEINFYIKNQTANKLRDQMGMIWKV